MAVDGVEGIGRITATDWELPIERIWRKQHGYSNNYVLASKQFAASVHSAESTQSAVPNQLQLSVFIVNPNSPFRPIHPARFGLCTEIENESDRNSGGAQIVKRLSLVSPRDVIGDFDLDDNLVFNKQIGAKRADQDPAILDGQRLLAFEPEPASRQGYGKRVRVHRFDKSEAKGVEDIVERADDFVGDVGVNQL